MDRARGAWGGRAHRSRCPPTPTRGAWHPATDRAARGRTTIRGVGELRSKESDRVAGIAAGLVALGAKITVAGDDIEIEGGRPLTGAAVETQDDHRLAMTFAVAGLVARGETLVRDAGSAGVSYPGFFGELERVRA